MDARVVSEAHLAVPWTVCLSTQSRLTGCRSKVFTGHEIDLHASLLQNTDGLSLTLLPCNAMLMLDS